MEMIKIIIFIKSKYNWSVCSSLDQCVWIQFLNTHTNKVKSKRFGGSFFKKRCPFFFCFIYMVSEHVLICSSVLRPNLVLMCPDNFNDFYAILKISLIFQKKSLILNLFEFVWFGNDWKKSCSCENASINAGK